MKAAMESMVRHHPSALPLPRLIVATATRFCLPSYSGVNMTQGLCCLKLHRPWVELILDRKDSVPQSCGTPCCGISLVPGTTDSAEQICCFQITTD